MDKAGFLIELSESERSHFGKRDFSDQSYPQQGFSSVLELEAEVNGGFLRTGEARNAEKPPGDEQKL